jgi:hypothetical protein
LKVANTDRVLSFCFSSLLYRNGMKSADVEEVLRNEIHLLDDLVYGVSDRIEWIINVVATPALREGITGFMFLSGEDGEDYVKFHSSLDRSDGI